jgi:hypothetical protein
MKANIVYYIKRNDQVTEYESQNEAEKAWQTLYKNKQQEKEQVNMSTKCLHPAILESDIVAYDGHFSNYEYYQLRTSVRPF